MVHTAALYLKPIMNSFLLLLLAVPAVLAQGPLRNSTIQAGSDFAKCLDVRGDTLADGTPVDM